LFLAPFLLSLSVLGFFPSPAKDRSPAGTDGQAKIVVIANLVLLPAQVTDSRGTFVPSLKLQNFRVYEHGQLQNLTVFEEGDTPVTVGLVVDHSRSMGSKLPDVITAVSSFAHSSNPQDEMFVVDFNDDVLIELMRGKAFSNDAKELEEALKAVSARGRTALYDAVSEGLHHLQYGHLEKKALIIISDGGTMPAISSIRRCWHRLANRSLLSTPSPWSVRMTGKKTRVSSGGSAKIPEESSISPAKANP
jgi:VWFA-related protein